MRLSEFKTSNLGRVRFQAIRKSDLQVGKALRYDEHNLPQAFSEAKVFVPRYVRVPTAEDKNDLVAIAEALLLAVFRVRRTDDYVWVKGQWYSQNGLSATPEKELRSYFRVDFWDGENREFTPMSPDWQPKTWKSFLRKLWDIKFTFRL